MSRWSVIARILAALPGGYALAALWSMAWVGHYGGARADAVLIGTVTAFAVWAALAIWIFAAASTARVLAGLALMLLLCAAGAWL
jgi:signal transduction histidine kinase